LTFGEIEDDATTTGGWFTPARGSFPQGQDSGEQGKGTGFGGSSWFTPQRPAARPEAASAWPEAAPVRPEVASAWREIPVRGATAANRWAEVTRGGSPAGTAPDDVPFRGARPIDVSAPRGNPVRRGPDYSAAAASAAPSAAQRRPESGALRRIRESGTMRAIKESGAMRALMDTSAMRTLMDTTAMQMLRERYAGKGRVLAIAGICLWGVLVAMVLILHAG
jgi:hypothetical protein